MVIESDCDWRCTHGGGRLLISMMGSAVVHIIGAVEHVVIAPSDGY